MEEKYVAMDVHSATISTVVLDSDGKKVMSTVMQTKEEVIRDFLTGLSGKVYLTFEEGCMAAWAYEITRPLVSKVVVCNPRHNRLVNAGNKSDRIDAEKLAELLRMGSLKPVYHQTHSVAELKHLAAIYTQLTADRTRVMNRLRAIFRSRALTIKLEDRDERAEYVKQLPSAAQRERAGFLLAELDMLDELQKRACKQMKAEAKKHPDYKRLQSMPGIHEIRAAELLAWAVTPARFRTKRQFWSYCGLSVVTRASADYEIRNGSIVPAKRTKAAITRGLNQNYNRTLKKLFKGAAVDSLRNKQIRPYYDQLLERGLDESVARVQLARKLAASCLAIWKSGEEFEYKKLILNSDKT
jgi:transposase